MEAWSHRMSVLNGDAWPLHPKAYIQSRVGSAIPAKAEDECGSESPDTVKADSKAVGAKTS